LTASALLMISLGNIVGLIVQILLEGYGRRQIITWFLFGPIVLSPILVYFDSIYAMMI